MTNPSDPATHTVAHPAVNIIHSHAANQRPSDMMRAVPLAMAISAALWAIALATLALQLRRG